MRILIIKYSIIIIIIIKKNQKKSEYNQNNDSVLPVMTPIIFDYLSAIIENKDKTRGGV